ncbi:hypothetical protein [Halorientalis pallida]|nr:hypothetical protein [Halorientalis pallida]
MGLYRFVDGDLAWHDPAEGDNCHLEVLVAEGETGRFPPRSTCARR